MTAIEDGLRAWADGSSPIEAAVELLIHNGRFIYDKAPWVRSRNNRRDTAIYLDRDALLNGTGAYSGGERRIAAIAVSLLGGEPVDLSDAIPGLDQRNIRFVLAAIAHAYGNRQAWANISN